MEIKKIIFLLGIVFCTSCSDNESEVDIVERASLQEYITSEAGRTLVVDDVIACAASADGDNNVSFVYYLPIEGATNIQYFENSDLLDKNNFDLYTSFELEKEAVFNGKLERYIRNGLTESWCIVSYETEGEINISNPIRLKNITKPTEWTDEVTINTENSLMPQFFWEDGFIAENAIYFEVLTDKQNDFISGTYTFDKWFQFYKLENVVLNITEEEAPVLIEDEEYNFTMLGVSEDNWVNLAIEKSFIAE